MPSASGPRSDGPRRRRSFTAADKLAHVAAYEAACETGDGGAYLRTEGLYNSQVAEWRRQRDAGVLTDIPDPGKRRKLTAEQAKIAKLRRELEQAHRKLDTTETALGIMGKAHALLEQISESADTDDKRGKR